MMESETPVFGRKFMTNLPQPRWFDGVTTLWNHPKHLSANRLYALSRGTNIFSVFVITLIFEIVFGRICSKLYRKGVN